MKHPAYRYARILSATTGLLALSLPAAAETALDEIVVTATRRADTIRDVPASVSRVDRSDFEAKATRFIGEELRGLPGLVVKTNDQGTYTDITIRGVPNRVHNDTITVLMDGVPFVTGDDEVDLEQLPFGVVGQVDVVRGPTSALYGRGAIAGTIHYITREVTDEPLAQAQLGAGSHDWWNTAALVQRATGDAGAIMISAQAQGSDGWRDRTDREEQTLFVKQRLDLTEATVLNLTGTYVNTEQGLAGELPTDTNGIPVALPGGRKGNWNQDGAGFDKRMWTGTAVLSSAVTDSVSATTRLHARHANTAGKQAFFNPYDPASGTVNFTGFRVDGSTDTYFAEQQVDVRLDDTWRVLAGVSAEQVEAHHVETWTGEFDFGPRFYTQRRDARTGAHVDTTLWRTDFLLNANARNRTQAAFAQVDGDWGVLAASVGARLDRFQRRVHYGPSGSGYGPDPEITVKDSDHRVSPKASLRWRVTDLVTAYAAFGEGFSPGFGPIWSFRNRDTNLNPEIARNIEAGLKGQTADERFTASLSVYQLKRSDLLQLLPVGGSARTINNGRQRSRGVELDASADLGQGTVVNLTYGYTQAIWTENAFLEPGTDRPFDFTGKDVAGVPRHAGRVEVVQALSDMDITLRAWADIAGDYAYDGANRRKAGGYLLANAAISWAALDGLDLTLTGRNLFDRAVNTVVANNDGPFAYYPQPPRQWVLTGTVRF
ncbi:TonB-dependent receptor [Niveispirillum lacus]|uniref:TonB-dependent receptor n=1 Tax=Niveispirillum lacus TaxID=1981099 RepID=A0A255YWZ5_9PROT|nr:TonB-dependent receptor [Niveispirillum lacus]OYQ33767.1 TonB-dependent receptor [Niveispirillum lacus]